MLLDFPAGFAPQASRAALAHLTPAPGRLHKRTATHGRRTPTTYVYTHLLIKWVPLLKIPLLKSSAVHYAVSGSLLLLSNNNGARRDLTCLMRRQMKSWRMQLRELSDNKKPNQGRAVWCSVFPQLWAGTLLLSVLESRCATRHGGSGYDKTPHQLVSFGQLFLHLVPYSSSFPAVW